MSKRPERQSHIVGGNIEFVDLKERLAWEETLESLGFKDEEIVLILASNGLNQYVRDLATRGKGLTEERKKEEFRILKEMYLKVRQMSREIDEEQI